MLIKRRRGWELPESTATPEHLFHQRRQLIKGIAAGPILLAGATALGRVVLAEDAGQEDPSAALYPVPTNERYTLDRPISDESLVTTYNNFYEFGSHKQIWQAAQTLDVRPWTVTLDGMVEREQTLTSTICCVESRSRSGSTVIAASRPGPWPCPGAASA